jgi:hypothetical protein
MDNSNEKKCPACQAPVAETAYFCPNCGKVLREKPPSTSIWKQIVVYAVSLFAPPFGLWYAWKYLRQPEKISKYIGLTAIILTVISVVITVQIGQQFMNQVDQSLNSYESLNF